ncbi:MAG TPA: hypothetical protein VKW78_01540 [Terriglobales bacterium]|nr:hypothetical protein [Terriglobales bacterium]
MPKHPFVGSDGKLRPVWRAALFFVAGTYVIYPLLERPTALIASRLQLSPGLTAGNLALNGFRNFIVCLALYR